MIKNNETIAKEELVPKKKILYIVYSKRTYAGEPCEKIISEAEVVGEDRKSFYIEEEKNEIDYINKDEIDKEINRFTKYFGCYTSLEKAVKFCRKHDENLPFGRFTS